MIPELGLSLGLWQGSYEGVERLWLRWFTIEGELIPIPIEEAEVAEARAMEAEERAMEAQERAMIERERAIAAESRAMIEREKAERLSSFLIH